jgi:membrane associated rhomboid family serine protease
MRMKKKTNGTGNHEDKIIKLPTLAERDRMRKAKEAMNRAASPKVPFMNLSKIPPFTRALIASFVVIHIALAIALNLPQLYDVYNTYGFVPGAFTGVRSFSWQTLVSPITHQFLHGNWIHLFFNTTMGLVMGMVFEKEFGAKAAAFFFFACGLTGAALYLLLFPFSETPIIGASAGLSGFFGAVILLFYQRQPRARFTKYGPWPMIGFWLFFMIALGAMSGGAMAWHAHVGGFLAGVGLLIGIQKGKLKFLFR